MINAQKSLALIDQAIATSAEDENRNHYGASLVGKPCARQGWYKFRWTKKENFEPRMRRLFDDGHTMEPRIIAWLRSIPGVEVWEAGTSGDNKSAMRICDHAGHFGGTPDGMVRGLPDWLDARDILLAEFKTHNEKSFNLLVEKGLIVSKFEHFVQMQIYMHYHKLKAGIYCAYCKNDARLEMQIIKYDERVALDAVKKASLVIFSPVPLQRISESPANFNCKFCNLARLCHFGDVVPDVNCRTCKHSQPTANGNGEWFCKLYQLPIPFANQLTGCARYEVSNLLYGSGRLP